MEEPAKMKEPTKKLLDFIADVPASEEHNKEAARQRGWRYDISRRVYVDSDGEMIADRFGQPL